VCKLPGHNQPVIANQRSTRGSDSLLAISGERQLSRACVSAVEGPFRFAVADHEGAGGCHFGSSGTLRLSFSPSGAPARNLRTIGRIVVILTGKRVSGSVRAVFEGTSGRRFDRCSLLASLLKPEVVAKYPSLARKA
jgi:hypothetical protein